MTLTSMGRVNVPTPGTPVRLTINPITAVSKILFQVIPGLTGKAYIGTPALNKATLAGVVCILAPNAAGGIGDQFNLQSEDGADTVRLGEYAIDMDVAGEGLLISYWTE